MIRVETSSGKWSGFCELIEQFLEADIFELVVDGEDVTGYRSPDCPALWIRDHSDILRAGKYFLKNVKSAVDCFATSQSAEGRVYDFVTTTPLGAEGEQENWEKWVRVPVEADVEYRFVKAAFLAWQASGDDDWLDQLLPNLDMALRYSTTHPWRWDPNNGLMKRAYTIDTWDFDYTAGRTPWLNFQITDDTFWGYAHCDSSGLYEAAQLLSRMYRQLAHYDRGRHWEGFANDLKLRANAVLFNGRFYTHFVKISDVDIEGVDEANQLSLSNPMAINRGLAGPRQSEQILEEYRRRREASGTFAEWFSIDPPFPDGIFGDEKLVAGAYVNGGIMPLVGGELARAALENGQELYGVATLEQYRDMITESGETYLWYFPDGRPSTAETSTSPDAMPTDGWGSSAMLWAFVEGLCGIQDRGARFSEVRLKPRWLAAGEERAEVDLSYPASGARFGYVWHHQPVQHTIELRMAAERSKVDLAVMLPQDASVSTVSWDGAELPYDVKTVGETPYVCVGKAFERDATVKIQYEV